MNKTVFLIALAGSLGWLGIAGAGFTRRAGVQYRTGQADTPAAANTDTNTSSTGTTANSGASTSNTTTGGSKPGENTGGSGNSSSGTSNTTTGGSKPGENTGGSGNSSSGTSNAPSPNEGSNQGTGNAEAAGGQTDPVSSSCTEIPLTYCTQPVQGAPPSQSPYANYGPSWCKCILELVNNQIKNGGASCAEVDKWFTLFAEMKDEPGSRCQSSLPQPDPWLNGFVSCWFEPICAGRSNTTDQSGFALGKKEDSQGKGCCDPDGCLGAFKSHGRSQQAWINATRPDPDSPPACSSADEEYFPFLLNGSCHDCSGCFKDFNPGQWGKISNFVEKGPLSCSSFGLPNPSFSP